MKNPKDLNITETEEERIDPILKKELAALDEEEIPPEASSWKEVLYGKGKRKMNNTGKNGSVRKWGRILCTAAAAVIVIGGTLAIRENRIADERKTTDNSAYKYSAAAGISGLYSTPREVPNERSAAVFSDADYAAEEMTLSTSAAEKAEKNEKIIRNVSFTMKTESYDEALTALRELTDRMGGRIENLWTNGDQKSGSSRRASLTLRIPKENLDTFLNETGSIRARISDYSESREDVSENYFDVETRLQTQEAKLQRLLEMLPTAKKVSEIIEIENAITDTQYYVDSYRGKLNAYDSKIDYSTVNVVLSENIPVEIREKTIWERMMEGLEDSLEEGMELMGDLLVLLIALLPWMAVTAVVIAAVRFLLKRKHKKTVKRTDE